MIKNLPALATPIKVIASPHPFKTETYEAEAPAGWTITEILDAEDGNFEVFVNGEHIAQSLWAGARPEPGSIVNIRAVPGKGLFRALLLLAVVAFAAWAGPAIAGAYFTAGSASLTVGGALIGGAITMVGSLLINALIPPVVPKTKESEPFNRLQSVTGVRNRVNPFGPLTRLYGTMKFFPPMPMTALPFTELVGDDQYIRFMCAMGYGPIQVNGLTADLGSKLVFGTDDIGPAVFIGETSIDNFEDVECEIGDPTEITLYTNTVIETAVGATMNSVGSDQGEWSDNVVVIRTTEVNAEEASVDVVFPGGLFSLNKEGGTQKIETTWLVEYRVTSPPGSWIIATPDPNIPWYPQWRLITTIDITNTSDNWIITGAEKKTLRRSMRWKFPAPDQYDVRLTRVKTLIPNGSLTQADAVWTVLRTIRSDKPFIEPDNIVLVMRIRATDQLNRVLDSVNVLCTAMVSKYNGSSWDADQATNNPAWAYADILTGLATKHPVLQSDLDATALKTWADWCDANNYEFNFVYDSPGTVFERAREVAAAGRAAWAIHDNVYTVVREEDSATPTQVISTRNLQGFVATKLFPDIPHALRVRFIDPDTFEDAERMVYDDGFDKDTATKFDVLDLKGVTVPDQAWSLGRFHLAQLRLRPEIFSGTMPIEYLVARRGDMMILQHDDIVVGLNAGRIKSVTRDGGNNILTFESDETLYMESGKDYGVKIRYVTDPGAIVAIASSGITRVVPSTTSVTLDTPLDPDIEAGDLFVYGEVGVESIEVKVIRIDPGVDLTAAIVTVPASHTALLNADSGPIPPYDPVITQPIDFENLPPPIPVVNSIRSDETALMRDADGSYQIRLVVDFTMPPGIISTVIEFQYTQIDTPRNWRNIEVNSDDGTVSVLDIEQGVTYTFRMRAVRGDKVSAWTAETNHLIIGKSSPPEDVVNFICTPENFGIRLTWDAVSDLDRSEYEVREGTTWASAILIDVTKSTEILIPVATAATHTFLIKAIDTTGNPSTTAASTSCTVDAPIVTGLSGAFEGPDFILTWDFSGNTFPIKEYEVRRGGSTWETATFIALALTKTYRALADWSGSEKWWVAAIDNADNTGTGISTDVDINLPSVGSISTQIVDNNVLLQWTAIPGTLPVARSDIKKGTVLETAALIGTSDTTFANIFEIQAGSFTYHIVPIDSAGNSGTAGQTTISVDAPPDFILRDTFDTDWWGKRTALLRKLRQLRKGLTFDGVDDYVRLDDTALSGKQDISIEFVAQFTSTDEVTVIHGINATRTDLKIAFITTGTILEFTYSTGAAEAVITWTLTDPANDGIARMYSIVRDQTTSLDVELYVDGVINGSAQALTTPATLSFPTDGLIIGAELTAPGSTLVSGTQFEGLIDEFRIWDEIRSAANIAIFDDRMLFGDEANLLLYYRMNEREGLVINDMSGNDDHANVIGATLLFPTTEGIVPFPTTETVADRETNNPTWTTPQLQVDAGYPYVAQPVPTSADIEEVYDLGVVVDSTRITVTLLVNDIVSGMTSSVQISEKKLEGDGWTDFSAGLTDVFATDFRYIKVKVTWTATDKQFGEAITLQTLARVKKKSDEGVITVSSNPTAVSFNETFLDIESIVLTPEGTVARITVLDFTDAPNPTDFDIYLFDSDGVAATGDVRWIARGS